MLHIHILNLITAAHAFRDKQIWRQGRNTESEALTMMFVTQMLTDCVTIVYNQLIITTFLSWCKSKKDV